MHLYKHAIYIIYMCTYVTLAYIYQQAQRWLREAFNIDKAVSINVDKAASTLYYWGCNTYICPEYLYMYMAM